MSSKCIFIFRRDLRLCDNTTLIYALKNYDLVLPVFIFDYNQLHESKNNFFIQAQNEAVADLNKYLHKKKSRLCYFSGKPFKIISYLIKNYNPNAVAFNNDYSNNIEVVQLGLENGADHSNCLYSNNLEVVQLGLKYLKEEGGIIIGDEIESTNINILLWLNHFFQKVKF